MAIGSWAVPALAGVAFNDPPKAFAPIPLENRAGAIGAMAKSGTNYQATLSGTLIKQASATTSWFLYPGACTDRANNTWVPRTAVQADSLNSYLVGSQGGYGRADQSLSEKLFHIVSSGLPVGQKPNGINGTNAIWAGKYDANWVNPVGYPNLTNQILYIDLESNRAPIAANTGTYTITMKLNSSTEQNYDFLYFIGGGDADANNFGDEDPLGNDRGGFDQVRSTGSFDAATLQATLTGSIIATTSGLLPFINGSAGPTIVGEGGSQPATVNLNFHMTTDNRAFYILFTADCLFSSEDGLWPFGTGVTIDDLTVFDGSVTRNLYVDQTAAGGSDTVGGDILVADPITATETDGVRISARVFPGKGELWAIQQGSSYTTSDICQTQKNATTDRFFLGVDPVTKNALPGQFNSVVTCTFAVPAGTADITALWGEYLNLPRTTGYVQYSEYRYFKDGSWSNWENTAAGGGVRTSVIDQWVVDGDPLASAVQADSFQVRYNIQCITAFAADRTNCDNNTQYAVLYDDLFLQVTTGVPAPVFGIFPGSVAQSTFVDGNMTGLNCTVTPCWPGIRGSDLQTNPNVDIARSAVKDNLNSPLGDSLTMSFVTGLRKNGMGINWHYGYDKSVNGGLTVAITNGAYNPAFDTPRVIYRLFDPASKTWSPWDSTSLNGNNVSVAGDTVVIDSEYRLNWPPADKVGLNLPGGFTINGQGAYNNLAFLPRGTRMQYYFKAVDINGGVSYQFTTDALSREVEDLPTLPGSANIAADIVEFDVLPRVYPAGTAGTLAAGRTDTPVLNLDGAYCGWGFGQDPVTAALRGMGVRADRYRPLAAIDEGHLLGGHELAPDRPSRQSNYFPNKDEYGIKDSLATWYRIMIQNSHTSTVPSIDESAAQLVSDWAATDTGANGGDRCIFFSGDDAFNSLTNSPVGVPGARKLALSTAVFGVANVVTLAPSAAKGSWAGTTGNAYPTIDDRFAAQASGPGLAAPGSFTYEVDGGCPGPNRFDPLTPTGGAVAAATFPVAAGVTDVAGVAKASELDNTPDLDQTKALSYGYSIQFVRGTAGVIPRNAANYVRSGVQNRMQILYKFLTGCRGARGAGSLCWPCPTDANLISNWLTAPGFNTATYGPLYPIQDFTKATGVEVEEASAAPRVNRIFGNSPNPFNPMTKISFSAAQAGKVTIRIFNVAGQLVRTLETKVETPGTASVYWDGMSDRNVKSGSGVYFYKATFANGTTLTADRSMVLVK
ncbi:MAG TPA: FlgD immunoglobulin-like domain containing protein [Candidatus Eisenbacteria bacterium]|nr:FlgD immunoglobulin-like domain containing protein [Candidatus Eisenbacteria bacterium]